MIKSLIWLPLCLSSLSASAFIDDNHDMNFAEQNEIIYNGLIAINTNPAKIKVENKLEAELQYYQTLEYFKYSSNKKYKSTEDINISTGKNSKDFKLGDICTVIEINNKNICRLIIKNPKGDEIKQFNYIVKQFLNNKETREETSKIIMTYNNELITDVALKALYYDNDDEIKAYAAVFLGYLNNKDALEHIKKSFKSLSKPEEFEKTFNSVIEHLSKQ